MQIATWKSRRVRRVYIKLCVVNIMTHNLTIYQREHMMRATTDVTSLESVFYNYYLFSEGISNGSTSVK